MTERLSLLAVVQPWKLGSQPNLLTPHLWPKLLGQIFGTLQMMPEQKTSVASKFL